MGQNGLKSGAYLKGTTYRIEKVLGQGSFGITYLATAKFTTQGNLGKMDVVAKVAIKEFFMGEVNGRSEDGSTVEGSTGSVFSNYRKKFRKEAENLSKLEHPNIVKVFDVFDENNTTYYVMDFIEGQNLDDYIKDSGFIKEDEAIRIVSGIGGALYYMHSQNMLHLDIKPKNIMRNADGKVYLIDFGLSKQFTDDGEPESSTSIGLGTPGYAPIEQAGYKQDGSLPATLDVYALGATLFKMLTGNRPPEATYILNEGFPENELLSKGVSQNTRTVLEKAMAPIKKQRYQSVISFINWLEGFDPEPAPKKEVSPGELSPFFADLKNEPISKPKKNKKKKAKAKPSSYQQSEPKPEPELKPQITPINDTYLPSNHNSEGTELSDVTALPENAEIFPSEFESKEKPKSNTKWYIIGACAAAVIIFVILLFKGSSTDQSGTGTGIINGHEWVDLGLPSGVKWATCNVGASTPSDYGNYYAWGETEPKSSYNSNNYFDLDNDGNIGKVFNWQQITITPSSGHDTARENWGGSWRMPTYYEIKELRKECKWTRTSQNDHDGYRVTGPNGNSIFLPEAGFSFPGSLGNGYGGYYWSSVLYPDNRYAYCLDLSSKGSKMDSNEEPRYFGLSVRPVTD